MQSRGLNAYSKTAVSYNSSSASASDRLAAMLKNPRKSAGLMKKAQSAVSRANDSQRLNRTDTTANEAPKFYQEAATESERAERLYQSAESMRNASVKLLSAKRMSDSDFSDTVKELVSGYNDTVGSLKGSSNYAAVTGGASMANTVRSYSVPLERAGITVNSDNTLTVDDNALSANLSKARTLFGSEYSLGNKLERRASEMMTLSRLTGNAAAGIYNRNGLL